MVKFLLEPLALIPYINASGDVAVFAPSMANSVDLAGKYDKNQSVFEEYEVLPMQWVGIANIDSAILAQEEITGNTSDIRYDLPYNPIRLDLYVEDAETAQEAVLEDFIDKAPFDAYTPCEVLMIVSDMSIKLGDKITTTRGTSYVSEMILSGPMLVEQQLISRGSQVQQEVEEEYDPVFAYLDNKVTEATEDLQEQIDNFEPSEEYIEKVNEFSSTVAAGMGLKTIKRTQDGATITYFYAPDANGAITNSKFVFVMKSNGFFWTNEWKGNADASSEGTTVWGQGIGSDGSSLLKILNAYKISADIIEGGTLQIKDGNGNVIHRFSNGSDAPMDIGRGYANGGISYDSTNGLRIADSVIIGAATEAAQEIVDDLDIRAIDHQEVKYQAGASNTTVPTGTWQDSPPSVSAGQYLWTRTITYYTDDTQSQPAYSVARQGQNGAAGTTITAKEIKYVISASGTTTPADSASWSTAIPSISDQGGKYLWTRTRLTYSDNTTTTAYSPSYIALDGQPGGTGPQGDTGRGITSITHQYCLKNADGSDSVETIVRDFTFPNAQNTTAFNTVVKQAFTPTVTDTYVFESSGDLDTYGYLFNANGSTLASNDDAGTGSNFKISYTLTAGTLYYLGARFYSSTNNGKTIQATLTNNNNPVALEWSAEPPTYVAGKVYWERDKIEWTSGTSPTYSPSEAGVKSNGLNKAILDANEANAAIGEWCYQNDRTRIDGGKIYTGSITADRLAVNTAFMNTLLAEDATVTGVLDLLASDQYSWNDLTTAEKNTVSNWTLGVDYDQITEARYGSIYIVYQTIVKRFGAVFKNAYSSKIRTVLQTGENPVNILSPLGLIVADMINEQDCSDVIGGIANGTLALYGTNAQIPGDLQVGGQILGSGLFENGYESFTVNSTFDSIQVNLSRKYSSAPKIMLTIEADNINGVLKPVFYGLNGAVSLTDFYIYWYTSDTTSRSYKIHWVAIP